MSKITILCFKLHHRLLFISYSYINNDMCYSVLLFQPVIWLTSNDPFCSVKQPRSVWLVQTLVVLIIIITVQSKWRRWAGASLPPSSKVCGLIVTNLIVYFVFRMNLFVSPVINTTCQTKWTVTCGFLHAWWSHYHSSPTKLQNTRLQRHSLIDWLMSHQNVNSPICMTRPNTDVLSTVLQFHLLCLNWYWHSLMPVLAPSPM